VNFSRLDLVGQGKEFGRGVIALPLASTSVELKGCPAGSTLTPHVVNDYGAIEAWPVVTLQVGADSPSPKGAQ